MEILVVLVIIGLMTSAVVMTFPADDSDVSDRAQLLVRDVNVASRQALLSGQPTAFGVSQTGYGLFNYQDGTWLPPRETDWPEDARITFVIGSERVKLTEDLLPLIIFEPTGMAEPYTLSVQTAAGVYRLTGRADGQATVETGS